MSTNLCRAALAVLLIIAGSTVAAAPAAATPLWHLLADVSCRGNTSIWSMDPDGGHKQLYLQDASDPAISPDNSHIAYATAAGVYVAPVNDLSAAQLVAGGDTHPAWSPDGSELVVQTSSALAILTSGGAVVADPVAHTERLTDPAWGSAVTVDEDGNPTGRVDDIAADTNGGIVSVHPDGTAGIPINDAYGSSGTNPAWGTDGSVAVSAGLALQTGSPGNYYALTENGGSAGAWTSAFRPDDSSVIAFGTYPSFDPDGDGSPGGLSVLGTPDPQPIWNWSDVPAYWATEFGGTPQSGCGDVEHPTWYRGTLGAADTTPPTVNCAAPDATWHAVDVVVACTATDTGSGLAAPGDASFTLTTSVPAGTETAAAATGSRSVCDLSANCTTAGPVGGIKVDKAPPKVAITSPAAGATVAQGASLTASYSCTDGGSGLASCAGPVASGAALDTSTPGPHTVTVTGRDEVGNTASASVTYTVTTMLPSVSIADASAREGNQVLGNLLLFRVTLSKPATATVRVTATPRPGTASTSDYFAVPLTLSLRAGQTTGYYAVITRGDRVVEPDETMTVTLSGVSGAVVGRGLATGTIVNDDR